MEYEYPKRMHVSHDNIHFTDKPYAVVAYDTEHKLYVARIKPLEYIGFRYVKEVKPDESLRELFSNLKIIMNDFEDCIETIKGNNNG